MEAGKDPNTVLSGAAIGGLEADDDRDINDMETEQHQDSDASDVIDGFKILYHDTLGHGTFGVVYKAQKVDTNDTVAVKVINLESQHKAAEEEKRNCLKLGNHCNIVQIYHVTERANRLYIFMEYCPWGDLREYVKRRVLTIQEKISLMIQIISGIAFLHEGRNTHRDLKPANILIQIGEDGRQPVVKLSDFGLSKFLGEGDTSSMHSSVGTPNYKAPEFWLRDDKGKLRYTRKVDIYASGLTFLAILQLSERTEGTQDRKLAPYIEDVRSMDPSELQQAIGYTMYLRNKNSQTIPDFMTSANDDDVTREVKNVIRDMIQYDESRRPEAATVRDRLQAILANNNK